MYAKYFAHARVPSICTRTSNKRASRREARDCASAGRTTPVEAERTCRRRAPSGHALPVDSRVRRSHARARAWHGSCTGGAVSIYLLESRLKPLLRLATACLLLAAAEAAPSQWQSPAAIRETAEAFAVAHAGGGEGVEVEAAGIDARLRLPACSAPLRADSEHGLRNGRGTVTVRCDGAQPWKLYVPVRVSMLVPVVVVAQPLAPDAVVGEGDVAVQMRRSTTLPYQYVSRIEDALGFTTRRSLSSGTVLVQGALARRQLVARGSLVMLVASARGIEVSGEGIAVEDAGLRERVRVRTPAGRLVEGVVEGPGRVRVGG